MHKLSNRGSWSILRRVALAVTASLAVVLIAGASLIAILNSGHWHRPVLHWVSAHLQRRIDVNGALSFRLFSLHPRIEAERVSIGNPVWCPPGTMAVIDHVNIVLRLPGIHRRLEIERLELHGATLNLLRDETGRANWQRTYPATRAGAKLPMIRSLSMPDARVNLDDQRRHLQFQGLVSARDQMPPAATPSGIALLSVHALGILNGKPMGLDLLGEPLRGAVRDAPYKFSFDERSSGSRASGRGVLPQAFDFAVIDALFEAHGPDLKDLYLLTGVHLIDTGPYRLTGQIARRGFQTVFSNLSVTSGESDVQGTVSVDSTAVRRKLVVDVHSHVLRLADLGRKAASRDAMPDQQPALLLPTTPLNVVAARKADASVSFQADRVVAKRAVLEAVHGKMTIVQGRIDIRPLQGRILDGTFDAKLHLDAGLDEPAAVIEADVTHLQLGQWHQKGTDQTALDGALRAHVEMKGHGKSIHAIAASAAGVVTASMSSGAIRRALAELAGVDLRGLGLLLSGSQEDTPVRCARARFEGHDGIFTAAEFLIDTDPVLITGSGSINFESETVSLQFLGQPKSVRLLRVDAPILVSGTLRKPQVGLQHRGAKLKIIDRGRPLRVDCPS